MEAGFLFLHMLLNIKPLGLHIALMLLIILASACKTDRDHQFLLNHIFELEWTPVDSKKQTFYHFLENGEVLVYQFKDFSQVVFEKIEWILQNDSLILSTANNHDSIVKTMVFRKNKSTAGALWQMQNIALLTPLVIDKIENTILIPAEHYGFSESTIPFLFFEGILDNQMLIRLFSACDYLSAQIQVSEENLHSINFPQRRFESDCPYFERSEEIKNQITKSDGYQFKPPDLYFFRNDEISGHWKAIGVLSLFSL